MKCSPISLLAAASLLVACGSGPKNGTPSARSDRAASNGPSAATRPLSWPVKDLEPVPNASSLPTWLTPVGSSVFFTAFVGNSWTKDLWKTDGTSSGTVRVKDLGEGSSDPAQLTAVGSTLFFTYATDSTGTELWRSDGTAPGTFLVRDIWPGSASSNPSSLTAVGNTLYFLATDTGTSLQLWKSDGTTGGTVLVAGNLPYVFRAIALGDALLFVAAGPEGAELWRSDGTAQGTGLLKDICPGPQGSMPDQLTRVGDKVFFTADDGAAGVELWVTDGTASGTVMVADLEPGAGSSTLQELTAVGPTLFLARTAAGTGSELWKSDGTAQGTVLVMDIYPGTTGSSPHSLTAVGTRLFFAATTGASGTELWTSDGTGPGTTLVKDLAPGSASTYPYRLEAAGGLLFFVGTSGGRQQLFRSDGTSAGTFLVGNIGSNPGFDQLVSLGGLLLFVADDGIVGAEVWSSDGTPAGTRLVRDLGPGGGTFIPDLAVSGQRTYFPARDLVTGWEPWSTDGTAAGSVLLKDILPGDNYFLPPEDFTDVGGTMFFQHFDGTGQQGTALWKSDGTPAGTQRVKDLSAGYGYSSISETASLGSDLIFIYSRYSVGTELWRSDGTEAGTVQFVDINPSGGDGLSGLFKVGDVIFFAATDGATGVELWRTDGTAAGTRMVKDIFAGASGSSPQPLAAAGGVLYFFADDGTHGRELWKSDGTAAGTVLVKDIRAGVAGSRPSIATAAVLGTNLLFAADDGVNGVELWKSDGTPEGTVLVKDIAPGSLSSVGFPLVVSGSLAYFIAWNDPEGGRELWKTDGTPGGTMRVKDIRPGPEPGTYSYYGFGGRTMVALPHGLLAFAGVDDVIGTEPWITDGTEAGTVPLVDIAPGYADSDPVNFVVMGERLLFIADDGFMGRSVWAVDLQVFRDRAPPVPTCPPDQVAEATSGQGAPVSYPPATATDDTSAPGAITIGYSSPSGSLFALGANQVSVTATDEVGKSAGCSFTVSVRDTVAPAVTCPADVEAISPGGQAVSVSYPPASATDAVTSAPAITYSVTSGSDFALGSTAVEVTAGDGAGNTATCVFHVTVRAAPADTDGGVPDGGTADGGTEVPGPGGSCGCSGGLRLVPAGALLMGLLRRKGRASGQPG